MRYLLLCLSFLIAVGTPVSANESEGIDAKEIVLGHLSDAYEWHITTIGGKHISIPLPVIVRSEATGEWHAFCSTRIEEAAEEGHDYMGFYFNEEKNGKIYERLADGSVVRPWDLSITKSVCQIWIVVFIMLAIFLSCARWYKKHDPKKDAPTGFVGMVEMLVMTINDDLIKDSIGEKHYRRYAPYLLTAFFFILITNLLGLLPIFPGGANVTGNINITFFLALCTMLAINLFGNKEYWKEIFWPDVPGFLKAYPVAIMPLIELFGVFTKPFALMVRLFANMMSGHMVVLVLVLLIFIFTNLFGVGVGIGTSIFSVAFTLFMLLLDVLVSFIQAYVFTILSTIFISMALVEPHEHEAK
jgi:F-type H+-transporting ATPase subunit a